MGRVPGLARSSRRRRALVAAIRRILKLDCPNFTSTAAPGMHALALCLRLEDSHHVSEAVLCVHNVICRTNSHLKRMDMGRIYRRNFTLLFHV